MENEKKKTIYGEHFYAAALGIIPMKGILGIFLLAGLVFLSCCASKDTSVPIEKDNKNDSAVLADIVPPTSYDDLQNSSFLFGFLDGWEAKKNESAFQESAYTDIFFYYTSNWDYDIVCNRSVYRGSSCFIFYTILNGRKDLCQYLPESKEFVHSGKYEPPHNVIHYPRATCIYMTELLERYNKAPDKLAFCSAFTTHWSMENCIMYTAWLQKNESICTKNLDDRVYSCLTKTSCDALPYYSVENYKCHLHACSLSGDNTDAGPGCRESVNELFSQWINSAEIEK